VENAASASSGSVAERSAGLRLLLLLCGAQFVVALDVTVVNVALPSIATSLTFGPGELQWVVSVYVLVTGALLLVAGRLSDLLGARLLFLSGVVVFTAASMSSGLAMTSTVLVLSRAAQGVGAALLAPAALSIISTEYTGAARAKALGVWGAIASGGAGAGLLVGGALTTWLDWRWVFFVNVPIGVVSVVAGLHVIPRRRTAAGVLGDLDVPGAALAALGFGVIVYAIGAIVTHGWISSQTLGLLAAGLGLLGVFAIVEMHVRRPLVPPYLWRQRSLTTSTVLMFTATVVLTGTLFLSTFLMAVSIQASPLETGVALVPTAGAIGFAAHLAGRGLPVLGARVVSTAGMIVAAAGALLLTSVPTQGASYLTDLLPGLALLGLGIGLAFPALSATSMSKVTDDRAGSASGLFMTAHDLGGAFGVALLSTVAAVGGMPGSVTGLTRAFAVVAVVALVSTLFALVAMPAYKPGAGSVAGGLHGGGSIHGAARGPDPGVPSRPSGRHRAARARRWHRRPHGAEPVTLQPPSRVPPTLSEQPTSSEQPTPVPRIASVSRASVPPEQGISCTGLTKSFGDVHAVRDLTFFAPMGAITGFIGANGAGKTTTMRMLLGLVEPTAGTALVAGRRVWDLPNPRRVLGAVLDAPGAHPGVTGRAHLSILASAAGIGQRRVDEVLKLVELTAAGNRRVGSYSLGMRQRLSLAGALLGDPPILLLDEPTKGLDPPGILWLRGFLATLAAEDRCVFVSSHHLAELEAVASRVVVLEHGRLVADGPLQELLAAGTQTVLVESPEAERLRAILIGHGAEASAEGEGRLRVVGMPEATIGEVASASGVVLHHLAVQQNELEDLFLELTSGATPDRREMTRS
jgi:EmrB/QacA subfamily drug resistance transporter